jgi:hypothetical protein
MVPVDETVLVIVPVATVWTVVVVEINGAALELLVASQVPTPAPATTTTTAPMTVRFLVNHFLCPAATSASLGLGSSVHAAWTSHERHASAASPKWRTHPSGSTYAPGNSHL